MNKNILDITDWCYAIALIIYIIAVAVLLFPH